MRIEIKGYIVRNDDKWIYDLLEMDATCPRDVNDSISKAAGEKLEVLINSPGGDVFMGSEIYTALRSYSGEVEICVVGEAASAASVIAMAGKCLMSPTAMMMVHNVSCDASGDYREMEHTSETLKTANQAIAAAYCAKSGMPEKDVLSMMDKETWLTAKQAADYKLVDGVMFDSLPLAASGSLGLSEKTLKKMRGLLAGHDPRAVKAKAEYDYLLLGGMQK